MTHSRVHVGIVGYCRELDFYYMKSGNVAHGFMKLAFPDSQLQARFEELVADGPRWMSLLGTVMRSGLFVNRHAGIGAERLLVRRYALHAQIARSAYFRSQSRPDTSPLAHWVEAERDALRAA